MDRATHERQRLLPSLDAAASCREPSLAPAAPGPCDSSAQLAGPDAHVGAADAAGIDAPSAADLHTADATAPPEPLQPSPAAPGPATAGFWGKDAAAGEPEADTAPASAQRAAVAEPACVPSLSPLPAAAGIVMPGEAPASHGPSPSAAPKAASAPSAVPVSTGPAEAQSQQGRGAGAPAEEAVRDPGSGGVGGARSGGSRSAGKENAYGNSGAASDKRKSAGKSGCARRFRCPGYKHWGACRHCRQGIV